VVNWVLKNGNLWFMKRLPLAKRSDIIQQESDKELLLYDLKTNRAFCLNATSAIIYQHCDGQTELVEFARQFGMNKELIVLALQRFEAEKLLAEELNLPKVPRRELLLKASKTAVALPFISALVAPTAVQAASCVNPGGASPGTIVQVCLGTAAACALPCQSAGVGSLCCSGMSGLGLCGASCNCVCVG